jgi:hypothetical protein
LDFLFLENKANRLGKKSDKFKNLVRFEMNDWGQKSGCCRR